MRRSPLKRGDTPLRRTPLERVARHAPARLAISPASTLQRQKAAAMSCIVCRRSPCDPAHLIDRSLCPEGADDPRAVVGLCRDHHDAYDRGDLDLLAYLEPWHREEMAYAVLRHGFVATGRRITNDRNWTP